MLKSVRANKALQEAQNYFSHHQFESATRSCRTALVWDCKLAAAHCLLGDIAFRCGDVDAAISAYREATVVTPQDGGVWAALGRVLLAAGNSKPGIDSYLQSLACDPGNLLVHLALAKAVHEHCGPEKALTYYKNMLRTFPRAVEGYSALFAIYRSMGDFERAAVAALNALTIQPDDAGCCCDAAEIRHLQGQFHEAIRFCQRAIAVAPRFPRAYLELGRLQMHLENYVEAENCLRIAISLEPYNRDSLNLLAEILNAQGYTAEAWAWRQRVDELKSLGGTAAQCVPVGL
jgi:tetratricopeptide (TPR) repeat protein